MNQDALKAKIEQRKNAERLANSFRETAIASLENGCDGNKRGFWLTVLDWLSADGELRSAVARTYDQIAEAIDEIIEHAEVEDKNWEWEQRYHEFARAVGGDTSWGTAAEFQRKMRKILPWEKYTKKRYYGNRDRFVGAMIRYFGQQRILLTSDEERLGMTGAVAALEELGDLAALGEHGHGVLLCRLREVANEFWPNNDA